MARKGNCGKNLNRNGKIAHNEKKGTLKACNSPGSKFPFFGKTFKILPRISESINSRKYTLSL